MVKLAAFPKCFIEDICEGRMSLPEWIEISRELHCDGLEFYSGFLASHDAGYLSEIRKQVEDRGMTIPMICHSPDFTHPDSAFRRREVEKQKEMIRVAAQLGTGYVRVLSGQKYPGITLEEGISWVVECIAASLNEAAAHHITLVMENHYKDGYWKYPEFAQKREIFLRIAGQLDSPYFGIQFDPSNALVANEDPLVLLERVAGRVRTVHASDRYIEPGFDAAEVLAFAAQQGYHPALRHGVVGKGLNDYPAIFKKLRSAGFDGWISIEDGINGLEEMKQSLDYLKELRAEFFSA